MFNFSVSANPFWVAFFFGTMVAVAGIIRSAWFSSDKRQFPLGTLIGVVVMFFSTLLIDTQQLPYVIEKEIDLAQFQKTEKVKLRGQFDVEVENGKPGDFKLVPGTITTASH